MLELTKEYLATYYPLIYRSYLPPIIAELTEAVKSTSINAVKKHLRSEGYVCPDIVKMVDTGEYAFHKMAREVYLNFEKAYVSINGAINGFDKYSPTIYNLNGTTFMVSQDHPVYQGYYLFLWIAFGELCEECGSPFVSFYGEDDKVCPDCLSKYALMEYNAKAEDILVTEDTKETLFGIELEYEGITAKQVGKVLHKHAISKRDGSVHNGVEVVTRPASVSTHKASLKPFYETVKVAAKSNTGMHVHVDKSKLSTYQIGFMIEFLNKASLIPDVEKIAGRPYSQNTYCKPVVDRKMTFGNKFEESSYKIVKTSTDKYSPLNTAKNKTIEVRIFSSPESHEEMCAKLDFVAALVKYSSPYSVSVKSLKDKFEWSVFIDFVKMNKKEFPHFVSYFLKG